MAAGPDVALPSVYQKHLNRHKHNRPDPRPRQPAAAAPVPVEPYRTYSDVDTLHPQLGLLDLEDEEAIDQLTDEEVAEMLRTGVIPAKTLANLGKQALFVASAKDIRDHFPSRTGLDPNTPHPIHTVARPSSLSKSAKSIAFPSNLRNSKIPNIIQGTPAAGAASFTTRASSQDSDQSTDEAQANEGTVVKDADGVPASTFQYNISVSYASKLRKWEPGNTFNFSQYNRVSFEKDWNKRQKGRPRTGQDAFFVSRVSDTGAVAFGVADGVGGYSESGIDSADFSHTLCEDMAEAAYNFQKGFPRASTLMEQGYKSACANPYLPGGGSTACIAVAKPDGTLDSANLGDSGFVILRGGRVHFTSSPQTHAFNTPFQLSLIPPATIEQARKFGGPLPLSDLPRDAHTDIHSLQHGDVVIFATDGLWDNLSVQDVLRMVSDEMVTRGGWVQSEDGISAGPNLTTIVDEEFGPSIQGVIARAVAAKAKVMSLNTKVDGPFAKEVQKYFPGDTFHGGKKDDICVLCCVAVEWKVTGGKSKPSAADKDKDDADTVYSEDSETRTGLPGGGGPGAPFPRL